jgi:hypothetical protein
VLKFSWRRNARKVSRADSRVSGFIKADVSEINFISIIRAMSNDSLIILMMEIELVLMIQMSWSPKSLLTRLRARENFIDMQ